MARSNAFTRVMEHIIRGDIVYVKDTGIRITVLDFNYHRSNRTKNMIVQVHFEDVPNKKAIEKCEHFHVRVRRPRGLPVNTLGQTSPAPNLAPDVDIEAHININDISEIPYETKAAKSLFKKEK